MHAHRGIAAHPESVAESSRLGLLMSVEGSSVHAMLICYPAHTIIMMFSHDEQFKHGT